MSTWNVELPLVGSLLCQVEADNEDDAIEKAQMIPFRIVVTEGSDEMILGEELEVPRYTGQGNISYLPCSEATAEKEDC